MRVPDFLALVDAWGRRERQQDRRAALVAYVQALAWLKKKNGEEFTIDDFMLVRRAAAEEEPGQTAEEMLAVMERMVADAEHR